MGMLNTALGCAYEVGTGGKGYEIIREAMSAKSHTRWRIMPAVIISLILILGHERCLFHRPVRLCTGSGRIGVTNVQGRDPLHKVVVDVPARVSRGGLFAEVQNQSRLWRRSNKEFDDIV